MMIVAIQSSNVLMVVSVAIVNSSKRIQKYDPVLTVLKKNQVLQPNYDIHNHHSVFIVG